MKEWINWSGSLKFRPGEFLQPRSEDELSDIIRRRYERGKKIRIAGAGHSSSSLVETHETLIQLTHFKGIVNHDKDQGTATLKAGMTIGEVNDELQKRELALFNTGDVDVQMLAGAISTGTHGTGSKLQNLSSMLDSVRLITFDGQVRVISEEDDPEKMKAVRVSLGAMGVFTEMTVKVLPLFRLHRRELCTTIEDCLNHFDQLSQENRNVDFYWYPRSDEAKIRILNFPGEGTRSFPFQYKCKEDSEDFIGKILPKDRELKFDEMEYAIPRKDGISCFREVRKRVIARHRREVAWRVLYRTIASDENYLSPHYRRDSVSISLHHNAGLPFQEYFSDLEPVFNAYNGRPHWGKKHRLGSAQLEALYPEWRTFHRIRRSFDSDDFFVNGYLSEIFGINA
jgi:FAD/FMN-containing dehydrogenase